MITTLRQTKNGGSEAEYEPYGELFIEERNSWNTPYKFSAKELDDETGYSYFGARYYDPNISIWLSVDPLSDKYPSHSPYNYTLNNPILFVDPDGRSAGDFYNENGTFLGTDGTNDGKVYVVTEKSEQKAIKETHKSGGTTQASSVNSRIELPSAYVRQKMGDAVDRSNSPTSDDTKGGFHEEGGVFGTHNGQEWVAEANPGPYSDPSKDSYTEINVLNTRSWLFRRNCATQNLQERDGFTMLNKLFFSDHFLSERLPTQFDPV